jgi:hypothetical protein
MGGILSLIFVKIVTIWVEYTPRWGKVPVIDVIRKEVLNVPVWVGEAV